MNQRLSTIHLLWTDRWTRDKRQWYHRRLQHYSI